MASPHGKASNNTRHVRFPEELDEQLVRYAELTGRTATSAIVHLVDESLNGPLLLRMDEGRAPVSGQ